MSFEVWAAAVSGLVGLIAAALATLLTWRTRRSEALRELQDRAFDKELNLVLRRIRINPTTESLDAKITKAHALSEQAAKLNAEVKAEFDLQFAAAKKAKADAETARREANDAEAVKKQYDAAIEAARGVISTELEGVVTKNTKAERRFQIRVALFSFLGGVVATTIVSLILQSLAG